MENIKFKEKEMEPNLYENDKFEKLMTSSKEYIEKSREEWAERIINLIDDELLAEKVVTKLLGRYNKGINFVVEK